MRSVIGLLAAVSLASLTLPACSNDPAVAQVALTSTLNRTATAIDGVGVCPTFGPFIKIGGFRGQGVEATVLIPDGEEDSGAPVMVECSVAANGDGGFDLDLMARREGLEGGSVTVRGPVTTSGVQQNIEVAFQSGAYGQYSATDCTLSYYAPDEDSSQPMTRGVAAGRVWGFLDCPIVRDAGVNKVCAGTAQIRFENCAKGN